LGGVDIAVQAARNFRALRRRGITIRKTIDNRPLPLLYTY